MKASPLPPITEGVIQQVRDRIVEAVHPEQLWLFGSAARGETRDGSDLDLLLVMPIPEGKSYYQHVADVRALFRGMMVPMDIFVLDQETFEYWKDTPGHLAYTVARHGRRLHGHG
jgi:predicted nucleotidyltransferase